MRAQRLEQTSPIAQRPLRLSDLPIPEPGDGQVRVRVTACGVCHTDLHTVEGDLSLPKLPVTPGHQVVGIIDAVGAQVKTIELGQRVGIIWLHRTCGRCEYCLNGQENLCEQAEFTGYHVDGGYAEFMIAPADFVFSLPDGLDDAHIAPLLCGGVIGYRALRLSEIKSGQSLGLYGFGNSAHIAIQIARHWGCEVYVFTRSPEHQEHALSLGAAWVGWAEDEPPAEVHASIIFAPAGSLVPQALRVLRPGGMLTLAGIHMSNIPEMPYSLLYRERTIRSVANSTRQDAIELLQLAAEVPIRTDVTSFPLDAANEVLLAMKESRFSGDAVLIP